MVILAYPDRLMPRELLVTEGRETETDMQETETDMPTIALEQRGISRRRDANAPQRLSVPVAARIILVLSIAAWLGIFVLLH
jgi:hypothetical protein